MLHSCLQHKFTCSELEPRRVRVKPASPGTPTQDASLGVLYELVS